MEGGAGGLHRQGEDGASDVSHAQSTKRDRSARDEGAPLSIRGEERHVQPVTRHDRTRLTCLRRALHSLIPAITGADEGGLPNRRGTSPARLDQEGDAQAGSPEEQGRKENKNLARGPHARAQGSISHVRLLNRTIGEHHVKPFDCVIMRKLRVVA